MSQSQEYLKNVLMAAIEEFVNSPETTEEDYREVQWMMLEKMDVLATRIIEEKNVVATVH